MQEGGSVGSSSQAFGFLDYVPYVSQTPVQPTVSTSTKGNTTSQAESILSDDMIKALLGKGLTNDVNAFLQDVQSMFSGIEMQNPFGSSINSHSLAMKQMALIAKINQIQNNKAAFDKSVDKARETGALDEIAVTSYGRILARDAKTGSISQINPDQLYEKRDKYIPLTNAELASLRMNSPNLAFDTNIFQTLENAVSSKEIDDFIRKAIGNLSSTSIDMSSFRSKQELEETKAGLKLLQDGVYKERNMTKTNEEQLRSAVNYLYRIMPSNYRAFLAAKSASEGVNPVIGVSKLIEDFASSKYEKSLTRDINYNKTATEGTTEKTKKENVANNPFMSLYNGVGAIKRDIIINPGTSTQFRSESYSLNALPSIEGKIIPMYSSLQTIFDSGLGVVGNSDNVYFGKAKLNPLDLGKVLYTGQGISRTIMLVDANGAPDIDANRRWNKVKELIRENNITDPEEIKELLKQYNVDDIYLPNGEINPNKFKHFFILNAAASNEQGVLDEGIIDNTFVPIEQVIKDDDSIKSIKAKFREATGNYIPDDIYVGQIFVEDTGNITTVELFDKNLKIPNLDGYTQEAKLEALSRSDTMNSNVL